MNKELENLLKKHNVPETILLGYMGSQSHGTYIPPQDTIHGIDDKDVMGVMIQPAEYYLGFKTREQIEIKEGVWDVVIYDFRKFIKLLCKNNPNVLGLLWLPDNMYIKKTEIGNSLLAIKENILAKECYHSFCGYARGQLKRMTNCKHEGYMGAKRKALVATYGYDTKNASHLIRLLKMGMEALIEGRINVHRHDAQMLIEIKKGKWSLEKVKNEAEKYFGHIETAFLNSKLQDRVPIEEIEEYQIGVLKKHLKNFTS